MDICGVVEVLVAAAAILVPIAAGRSTAPVRQASMAFVPVIPMMLGDRILPLDHSNFALHACSIGIVRSLQKK